MTLLVRKLFSLCVFLRIRSTVGFPLNCNLPLQPKLLSYELLDLVSSHFNLKEKEFFGLAFLDDKYVKHQVYTYTSSLVCA